MSTAIESLLKNQRAILLGEIGALLHDVGKCDPRFIRHSALDKDITSFAHERIDREGILSQELVDLFQHCRYTFTIGKTKCKVYELIRYHGNIGHSNKIVRALVIADRLDSADDKGIVRKKQLREHTVIATSFGYPKKRICLAHLKQQLDELNKRLQDLDSSHRVDQYSSKHKDIGEFRNQLLNTLRKTFQQALGETRIPSNDVTLWDHSYSVATLFKSLLCKLALGEELPTIRDAKWRIWGICWNGEHFVNAGRKPADILARKGIIDKIQEELRQTFEVTFPIGNAVYTDLNGIYFSFPDINNKGTLDALMAAFCTSALEIVENISNNELWPFFTLSKPSRTLTVIAEELAFAREQRNLPKVSPVLFVFNETGLEKRLLGLAPILSFQENIPGRDVCPVCQLRVKLLDQESCPDCTERKSGRLKQWLDNRNDSPTIWLGEIADRSNRIALISLRLGLEKWLDGTLFRTVFSQSYTDWLRKAYKQLKTPDSPKLEPTEKISRHFLEQFLRRIDLTSEEAKITGDKSKAALILDTFFEELNINENNVEERWSNIASKIHTKTPEELQTMMFTVNPSPARLMRLWRDTDEFWTNLTEELKTYFRKQFGFRSIRLSFCLSPDQIRLANGKGINDYKNTPFMIGLESCEDHKLKSYQIQALHIADGKFITIHNLQEFDDDRCYGPENVRQALTNWDLTKLALEDEPEVNLLETSISPNLSESNIQEETYIPFLELLRTPFDLKLLVPALEVPVVLKIANDLFNRYFQNVLGKVPLNVSLIVANEKFPLYALLDAEQRMLKDPVFNSQQLMEPWWDTTLSPDNPYYRYYPTKKLASDDHRYVLADLVPFSRGTCYALYPGFFDFELLQSTGDRNNINYHGDKRGDPKYQIFSGRPRYFYQIEIMLYIWQLLRANLTTSQIHKLEMLLIEHSNGLKNIPSQDKKPILKELGEAALRDAFGARWSVLRPESRTTLIEATANNLLLDTINLFVHVCKVREVKDRD